MTKFLKCVLWTDTTEVRQAVDILPLWVAIDVDDALELLGKEFENRSVRTYAVNQLRRADDDVSPENNNLLQNDTNLTPLRIYCFIFCN